VEPGISQQATGAGQEVSADREDLVELIDDPIAFLENEEPVLRRMATTALNTQECEAWFDMVVVLLEDASGSVRAAAAEKLGACGERALSHLAKAALDTEPEVREAVATAYGEVADPSAITWLIAVGNDDSDRTVKEAAVASLGAIGSPLAIDALLTFVAKGPPQVRRRAIAAITVFDDPRIEPAIQRAAFDRNPSVREAAEMVVGRQLTAD
jgi:HEAT repeat protein